MMIHITIWIFIFDRPTYWWRSVVAIVVVYVATIATMGIVVFPSIRSIVLTIVVVPAVIVVSLPCIDISIIAIPIIAVGVVMIGWVGGTGGRLGRVRAPAPLFYVRINWHVANYWLWNNENSNSIYHELLLTSTYCIINYLRGMVSMYDESALLVIYWLCIFLDNFRVY